MISGLSEKTGAPGARFLSAVNGCRMKFAGKFPERITKTVGAPRRGARFFASWPLTAFFQKTVDRNP